MLIDILYLGFLLFAVFKGYSKGFVVAVFSFLAIFIGLAAALKLSAAVAEWLGRSTNMGERLLPILAFGLVMLAVGLLVRISAVVIEKSLQLVMLGFINKLAGILLYLLLYTLVFSILLYFGQKVFLFTDETIADSYFFDFVQPWGPKAISLLGDMIPLFKNMFEQLENFFGRVAGKSKFTYLQ